MKLNKSFLAIAALGGALLTGCADDFAELNQNKASVTTPNVSYLFANAVNEFEPSDYTYWFYNAPMLYSWNQMGIPTSGMTTAITTTTNNGGQGTQYIETLRYLRDIDNYLAQLPEEDAKNMEAYRDAVDVLTIFLGIHDSDLFGNLSYTEACMARYGGTLTPKFDTQKDLYDLWLSQLDEAINTFQTEGLIIISTQDVVCKGDLNKWAKFANSLKLRIAVRLIAQDIEKAKAIAAEVKSASCGYIDSMDDAILFGKATTANTGEQGTSNDLIYHWSNGFMEGTAASGTVVNFMVENLDPRVRFCYQKNQWNSKIVQAYYDRGKSIPDFIENNVEYTTDASGKKKFVAWKGAGEPWVRYYGLPIEYNSQTQSKYDWIYRYSEADKRIAKADGSAEKSYRTFSYFQQQMVIGRYYNVSVPTTPEEVKSVAAKDRPWYGLYLGGAEINLYLAEFAMLNGDEAAAKTHYDKALSLSVQEYDKLAQLNEIQYYGTTYDYDPNEVSIELKDGEIETMMQSEAYAFTGTAEEKMEKIYIQQMLNFTLYPNEQFITARRSGYPKIGSTLLPREDFADLPVNLIPRRLDTGLPLDTDLMYDILVENYKSQGLTPTSNGSGHSDILNSERIWADQGAPQWGAGHNY